MWYTDQLQIFIHHHATSQHHPVPGFSFSIDTSASLSTLCPRPCHLSFRCHQPHGPSPHLLSRHDPSSHRLGLRLWPCLWLWLWLPSSHDAHHRSLQSSKWHRAVVGHVSSLSSGTGLQPRTSCLSLIASQALAMPVSRFTAVISPFLRR